MTPYSYPCDICGIRFIGPGTICGLHAPTSEPPSRQLIKTSTDLMWHAPPFFKHALHGMPMDLMYIELTGQAASAIVADLGSGYMERLFDLTDGLNTLRDCRIMSHSWASGDSRIRLRCWPHVHVCRNWSWVPDFGRDLGRFLKHNPYSRHMFTESEAQAWRR